MLLKKVEQADKITLWACKVFDPELVQDNVTSKKLLSDLSSLNVFETFSAKSFLRRQKLSMPEAIILMLANFENICTTKNMLRLETLFLKN